MKLSVKDRVELLACLPRQGNFTNLRLLRELAERIELTPAEEKTLKFVADEHGTRWDPEGDKKVGEIEVALRPAAHALIVKTIEDLEKREQAGLWHLDFYDRIKDMVAEKPARPARKPRAKTTGQTK